MNVFSERIEFIKTLYPTVSRVAIVAQLRAVALMSDDYLISEYVRLAKSIPPLPFGAKDTLMILRDDALYLKWARQDGVYWEAVEGELYKRNIVVGTLRGSFVVERG
jgi:hypothetical protein